MELYLGIKRNEVWTHTTTWMSLKNSKLSDRGQSQRTPYYIFCSYKNPKFRTGKGKYSWQENDHLSLIIKILNVSP